MKNHFILFVFLFAAFSCSKSDNTQPQDLPEENDSLKASYSVKKYLEDPGLSFRNKTDNNNYIAIDVKYTDIGSDILLQQYDTAFNLLFSKVYNTTESLINKCWYYDELEELVVLGYEETVDENGQEGKSSWISRLNLQGDTIWKEYYGDGGRNYLQSVLRLDDGSFMAVGHKYFDTKTSSSGQGERSEVWVLRTNNQGEMIYEKSFGVTGYNHGFEIFPMNGNYLLSVHTRSANEFFSASGNYLILIDIDGNVLWKKNLGGMSTGRVKVVDNDEIIAFYTSEDAFVVKRLNQAGEVLAQNEYNFMEYRHRQPFARGNILLTDDGGYVFSGFFNSLWNELDATIFRVDKELNLKYFEIFEGEEEDFIYGPFDYYDNKYFFQLTTESQDLELVENEGYQSSAIITVQEEWY